MQSGWDRVQVRCALVSKVVEAAVEAAERRADTQHEWHIARKTKEHSGEKLGGPAVVYLVVKYGD